DGLDIGGVKVGSVRMIDALFFNDIRWSPFPRHMHNHLYVGDVRQRIERNIPERPDSRQDQEQSAGEHQESIARAPINHAGDHGYIPPSAFTLSCLVARTAPFLTAVTVSCHVPPLSRFTCPWYMPPPFSLKGVRTFMA